MNESQGPLLDNFFSGHYRAHNQARLDHLASLELPLQHRTVLELGSGPGDHTLFYLSRGCRVSAVDARQECLDILNQRYPQVPTYCVDLNHPSRIDECGPFQVVHCYGILYHLEHPESAIAAIGRVCTEIAIVETCVSPGEGIEVLFPPEPSADYTQSVTGRGCRPTRRWVFNELRRCFPHVYVTATQPDHAEFPLDWTVKPASEALTRCVFVASRTALESKLFIPGIPSRQTKVDENTPGRILGNLAGPIKILDLGAMFVGRGAEPYAALLSGGQAQVVGFEANPVECAKLNREFAGVRQFFPYAIADGATRKFYECKHPMTSSLYEPDDRVMALFQELHDVCQVERVSEIKTWRLDDVAEARDADFLKLDLQGAEYEALQNAPRTLSSILVVQTEVEFVPIYKAQPLFADVDRLLRGAGLEFFRFANAEGRPLRFAAGAGGQTQTLWADAVYVRPPSTWANMSDTALAKLAFVLHALYRAFGHAAELLRMIDDRNMTQHRGRYLAALGFPESTPAHSVSSRSE